MTHRQVDKQFISDQTIVLSSKLIDNYIYTGRGDNINDLNPILSEFTHIYWLWKNRIRTGRVQLNHYRRYLTPTENKYRSNVYNEFKDAIDSNTIVCVKRTFLRWRGCPLTCTQHWRMNHLKADLEIILAKIEKSTASKIIKYFRQYKRYSLFNMFDMSDEKFDEYCEWIFEILLNEELISYAEARPDAYQRRMLAFFGERLTSYWIHELSNTSIDERAYFKFDS